MRRARYTAQCALRPSVGELAHTAARLGPCWTAAVRPGWRQRSGHLNQLSEEILPCLDAEEHLLLPVAEERVGGPRVVGALRQARADFRQRSEALCVLVACLARTPNGQHLRIEDTTILSTFDAALAARELDELVEQLLFPTQRSESALSSCRRNRPRLQPSSIDDPRAPTGHAPALHGLSRTRTLIRRFGNAPSTAAWIRALV